MIGYPHGSAGAVRHQRKPILWMRAVAHLAKEVGRYDHELALDLVKKVETVVDAYKKRYLPPVDVLGLLKAVREAPPQLMLSPLPNDLGDQLRLPAIEDQYGGD